MVWEIQGEYWFSGRSGKIVEKSGVDLDDNLSHNLSNSDLPSMMVVGGRCWKVGVGGNGLVVLAYEGGSGGCGCRAGYQKVGPSGELDIGVMLVMLKESGFKERRFI